MKPIAGRELVRAAVLLSGGLDSMATAALLLRQGHRVEGLFVDYGQASAERERAASEAIASALRIPLTTCNALGLRPPDPPNLPGRNGLLLHIALHVLTPIQGLIAIGIHSGSIYPDCTEAFIDSVQRLFDLYTGGTVSAVAPFLTATKEAIWQYCQDERLPVDLSYSCELGLEQPCGRCLSCDDRRRLASRA